MLQKPMPLSPSQIRSCRPHIGRAALLTSAKTSVQNTRKAEKAVRVVQAAFRGLLALIALAMTLPAHAGPGDQFVKVGRDHMNLFQFEKARDSFEKAVGAEPNHAEAHFLLGTVLRRLNRLEEACAALEKANALDGTDLECQKALAGIYVHFAKQQKDRGNQGAMLDFLHKACIAHPANTSNWFTLLDFWRQEGRWAAIAEVGDRIRKANREALEVGDDRMLQQILVLVARAHKHQNQFGRAQDFLRAAGMIRHANEELITLRKELSTQAEQVASTLRADAEKLFQAGRYKEAIPALRQAEGADPGNRDLAAMIDRAQKKISAAGFLAEANDNENKRHFLVAIDHLQRAREFDPDDSAIPMRIASITGYLERMEKEKAKAYATQLEQKEALLKRQKELDALLNAGSENEKKHAFDAAALNFEKALEMAPDRSDIQDRLTHARTQAEAARRRMERFGNELNRAYQLDSAGDFQACWNLLSELGAEPLHPRDKLIPLMCEVATKLEQWDDLDRCLEEWRENKPDEERILYLRGKSDFRRERYVEAWEALDQVYKKNSSYAPDLSGMIWRLRFNKYKYGIFLVLFFLSFKVFSVARHAWKNLAQARQERYLENAIAAGRYEEVIPLLEARLDDGGYLPNRKQLTLALAEAYLRRNRHADAATRAREILNKEARNATARRILGEAMFVLKDTSNEGIEHILGLFKLDESRKDLLAYAVEVYRQQQADHKTALEVFQKHLALNPDDQATARFLADLFLKRRNFATAHQKVFERAVRFSPDRPDYQFGLIQCLLQAGKTQEAGKLQEAAVAQWPTSEYFAKPEPAPEPSWPGMEAPCPTSTADEMASAPDSPEPGAAPQAAGGITCRQCGAGNGPREYYCTTCGKPL
jgi:cytochrome c-type biogenesis protein CcmH/NrfG